MVPSGNIELLKYLLSKGVEVDSESDSGTPLVWAAGHAQQDAVKVLLEHHANVIYIHFCFLLMTFISSPKYRIFVVLFLAVFKTF